MSDVTDYLNGTIKPLCDAFFDTHSHEYDLSENEGCGKYTEALVHYLRSLGHTLVGHLKKNPGQTQYNGHANDAFLYRVPDPDLYRAVDVIAAAESKPPYPPNPRPSKNFGIDIPRYTDEYWYAEPSGNVPTKMVPWVGYDEHSFQKLKEQLAYDYARRPQGADFDVTVWSARVFHSWYMGPDGIPLGQDAAIHKHRTEWCAALGVPVDDHWV